MSPVTIVGLVTSNEMKCELNRPTTRISFYASGPVCCVWLVPVPIADFGNINRNAYICQEPPVYPKLETTV